MDKNKKNMLPKNRTLGKTATIQTEERIPIVSQPSTDVEIKFSDLFSIIHNPQSFIITFLQSRPPVVTQGEQWERVKEIPAATVARIVVTPANMLQLKEAFIDNWNKYEAKYIKKETDKEDKK